MLYYERKLKKLGFDFIIGVDEAGRGPLAGPVVAAAAYLKKRNFKNRIDDSKKLSSLQRENAYQEIILNSLYGVGIVSEKIIDQAGIVPATVEAMQLAIKQILSRIKIKRRDRVHFIIDGIIDLKIRYSFTNIIKGDSKSLSIAAASIIAKVTRDKIMSGYHKFFPEYNFLEHKGYPTRKHIQALRSYGPCAIHRLTFSYG